MENLEQLIDRLAGRRAGKTGAAPVCGWASAG